MVNRAEELITCLEAEILTWQNRAHNEAMLVVERDARIAELEAAAAQKDERISIFESNLPAWGSLRLELAALKTQQPSAGVVLPPQCTDKQAHVKYRCGWNSCLSAVTRLNQPGNAVTVLPDGWVPLTIEHEEGYPEDVAFGPQRMMDRLKKWLDRYFAMRLNPPGECVAVPRELLADLVSLDREKRIPAERHLYALLAQQKESDHE